MKSLAEVFVEVLAESEKDKIRLRSDGTVARVKLGNASVQKFRETVRHRGDLNSSNMHTVQVAFPYTHQRRHVITGIRQLDQPDHLGNTHELTTSPAGDVYKSTHPVSSSKRGSGEYYTPPIRTSKPKTIKVGKHPKYGWVANPRRDSYEDPGRQNPYIVKPKND